MIHLVHSANRRLYAEHLRQMHRQRHDHFIVERGWSLTERDGGEYDQFDDDEAMYLLGFSPDGEVCVSARYRSTHSTSLIADIFPELIAPHELPVKAAHMYEATRYCAAKGFRGAAGFGVRSQLHVAVIELMNDLKARRLLGFMDLDFIPYFRKFSGMRLRPIGIPQAYDEGVTLAFDIGVGPEDLAFAQSTLRIGTRQLFEAPAWLPSQADPLALAATTEILINADPDVRRHVAATVREQAANLAQREDIPALMAELAKRAA